MAKNLKQFIIAHRGESFDAPENSLAAINLAWSKNADAVEIDIHLTKDRHIVVIHDATTKRIGDADREIKTSTLPELKQINIGNAKFPDEKIPTLTEVLKTIPAAKKLIIEIKADVEIVPLLKKEIDSSGKNKEQIEFIGFDFNTMCSIKKEMPDYNVLWILELKDFLINKIFTFYFDRLLKKVQENNLDGFDLWAGKVINKKFVEKIKSAGKLVYLWTVNDPEKAKKFYAMGVDAITTDRADWMRNQLNSD